jgi:hypothetical protein
MDGWMDEMGGGKNVVNKNNNKNVGGRKCGWLGWDGGWRMVNARNGANYTINNAACSHSIVAFAGKYEKKRGGAGAFAIHRFASWRGGEKREMKEECIRDQ